MKERGPGNPGRGSCWKGQFFILCYERMRKEGVAFPAAICGAMLQMYCTTWK